jgi:hypothetical protein
VSYRLRAQEGQAFDGVVQGTIHALEDTPSPRGTASSTGGR